MIKKTLFKIIFGIIVSSNSYAGFFEQSAEGWHWYQDPVFKLPEAPKESAPGSKSATAIIEEYKKRLEHTLHLALVEPSYKNVKAYQLMQKDLTERSEQFAKTWMQVVYQNPELDHTLVSPVNQQGRHIHLDQEKLAMQETIATLKDQYGLFFFFSSSCQYCHQFAPIVEQFATSYGWKVVAISLDGDPIPQVKHFMPDNGLAAKWQVQVLPSLFAVNPQTGHILPVAFGLTSIDQIETRIMALINTEDHHES